MELFLLSSVRDYVITGFSAPYIVRGILSVIFFILSVIIYNILEMGLFELKLPILKDMEKTSLNDLLIKLNTLFAKGSSDNGEGSSRPNQNVVRGGTSNKPTTTTTTTTDELIKSIGQTNKILEDTQKAKSEVLAAEKDEATRKMLEKEYDNMLNDLNYKKKALEDHLNFKLDQGEISKAHEEGEPSNTEQLVHKPLANFEKDLDKYTQEELEEISNYIDRSLEEYKNSNVPSKDQMIKELEDKEEAIAKKIYDNAVKQEAIEEQAARDEQESVDKKGKGKEIVRPSAEQAQAQGKKDSYKNSDSEEDIYGVSDDDKEQKKGGKKGK